MPAFQQTLALLSFDCLLIKRGLAMNDKEKLLDLLYQTLSRSHCDDCLAAALVMNLAEVQELTLSLVEDGWSKRRDGQCSCCGQDKVVNARRVSAFAA